MEKQVVFRKKVSLLAMSTRQHFWRGCEATGAL